MTNFPTTPAPFAPGAVVTEKTGERGIGGRGGNTYLVVESKWLYFTPEDCRWTVHVRRWIKTTQKYSGTTYSLRADRLELVA